MRGNMEMSVNKGFSGITDMDFMNEAMNDECADLDFSKDRIKIPGGGMTAFEVPAGDGENTEMEKEIICVILYSHATNSYYRDAYKGGSNPPDCGSMDGKTGIGIPGGDCRTCPLNEFGSGGGKAKACKNKRMLYILRENEIFPMMLILPPGSLRTFSKYVQSLLSRRTRPHQVVTKISLRKMKTEESPEFSQAVFKCMRTLDETEQAGINGMIEQVRSYDSRLGEGHFMQVNDPDNPFVDPETGEIM